MDSKKIGRPQKDTRPVNDEKKQIINMDLLKGKGLYKICRVNRTYKIPNFTKITKTEPLEKKKTIPDLTIPDDIKI